MLQNLLWKEWLLRPKNWKGANQSLWNQQTKNIKYQPLNKTRDQLAPERTELRPLTFPTARPWMRVSLAYCRSVPQTFTPKWTREASFSLSTPTKRKLSMNRTSTSASHSTALNPSVSSKWSRPSPANPTASSSWVSTASGNSICASGKT